VDNHPKVKKAFIGSGIRHELLTKSYNKNADKSINDYIVQLLTRHVSGRLKVAPEHTSADTLKIMRKPSFAHVNLAVETKELGFKLEHVQDFTPTPMTVATVMYYSGYHPYTLKKYYIPKSKQEKSSQHRFFFWYKKENRDWIRKRLMDAKRPDLLKRLLDSDQKELNQQVKSGNKIRPRSSERYQRGKSKTGRINNPGPKRKRH
jgi:hypothetical protein